MTVDRRRPKTDIHVFYRIEELENKIGAGLIEEVVQVAENELKLVEVMKENKVYVFAQQVSM